MEKLTYKNVRTKVAGKATGNKNQKSSVASELIFALSKPKIKKEIKEEQSAEVTETAVNKKIDLKDFQATIAKNLNVAVEKEKLNNTVKLSNKTKYSSKRNTPSKTVDPINESTEEEKAALKNKVNNDWINFLKKRQDPEPIVDDVVVELEVSPKTEPAPPQQQPKRKRNVRKEVFSTEVPAAAKFKSNSIVNSKTAEVEKDSDKDLILKNLMNQVAQLESSMGANISKLEAQLREEKDKSKKLEADIENEKENYSDIATKLISIKQNKLSTEESHQKKLTEIEEELKCEKSKSTGLAKDLSKLERTLKDEKKSKEKLSKDLISLASDKESLKLNVDYLKNWKEESIIKIKASLMNCQEEHVQRIKELEDSDELKSDMIVEISTRMSMIISEYSYNFNLKEKEIESLKEKVGVKDDDLKEKDKRVNELEIKLKEKETRCREKEENEEKYKVKVERYREKEDRYKEKEERFKEKEKKFKEREEKFVEIEKRLMEKERKFKENDEKLRQKEDEMFRVYELVNQLQMRMKNDKINPIVNGQDILSIGKSKSTKSSTEAKDEDEDVCILPTPVKVSERAVHSNVKSHGESSTKGKDSEKPERSDRERRLERKVSNDPRQKDRVSEAVNATKSREIGERQSPKLSTNESVEECSLKTSSIDTKSSFVKVSDLKGSPDRGASEEKCAPSSRDLRNPLSAKSDNKSNSSSRSASRRCSGNPRRSQEESEKISTQTSMASSKSPKTIETSVHKSPFKELVDLLVKPVELLQKTSKDSTSVFSSTGSVHDAGINTNLQEDCPVETSSPSEITEVPRPQGLKRKPENQQTVQRNKKTNVPSDIAEEEILLLDDEEDDDDIQCVMEIKAPLASVSKECSVEKDSIKDAVKNFLTEEKTKTESSVVKEVVIDEEDDELMEFDLPEPVPCLKKIEEIPVNASIMHIDEVVPVINSSSSSTRMKASDFFQAGEVENDCGKENEVEKNCSTYDEGLELENWISMQLRLERQRIESGETKVDLDNSVESISDSSQETLKKMFLLDLELQESDQNENQISSKPFYVNPDITWALQKWPNLPERLASQSESPKPKDSECKIVHETEVQDPRLRRKYGLDATSLNVSYQQLIAMKKVVKFDEKFHIPRAAKNLMLPYLWPMVKYVKKDLMTLFDASLVENVPFLNVVEPLSSCSPQQEVIELEDDAKEDEATIIMLYDDLEINAAGGVDTYNSEQFSTKRTWDEMKSCDLSMERTRIIDELKMELNQSRTSDISSLDESNSDLLFISFEEEAQDENCDNKKIKFDYLDNDNRHVLNIVQELIEECFECVGTEDGGEEGFTDLKVHSLLLEEDDLEIIESEATKWTDDSFDYKCTYLPADLTGELDKGFENVECFRAEDDTVISDGKNTSVKPHKPEKVSRMRQGKRRGTVERYLGSKRCFGRSLF